MTITDRRRALMGAANKNTIRLKDLNIGDYFKATPESTLKYIVFFKSPGQEAVLAVKEYLQDGSAKFGDTARYNGSYIDTTAINYIQILSAKFQSQLTDYTFESQYSSDGTALRENLTRKIFIPKAHYADNAGAMTAALKVFYNTTDANTARKARHQSVATYSAYWSCDSKNNGTNFVYQVGSSGSPYVSEFPNRANGSIRFVFSMKQNAEVKLINGEYILQ